MMEQRIKDIQTRLMTLGYALPKFGADGYMGGETRAALEKFQHDRGVTVTGMADPRTLGLLFDTAKPAPAQIIPAEWMPAASMQRIIVHWTAGAHKASSLDKDHYHILIAADGTLVRGNPSIRQNQAPVGKDYAAHTLGCNSGSIGVSLCCMALAKESPFDAGTAPMTRTQWEKLPHVLADLCRRYAIPVAPKTVLSHAEVQKTLGIQQRGKWDIARLAFDPSIKGATACGDIFRRAAQRLLQA